MSFFSPEFANIPTAFHSVEFDGPFQKCMICHRALLDDSENPYLIEKIYRGKEAIVEMAICVPCLMEMQNEISEESAKTIKNEFQNKIDWDQRYARLSGEEDDSVVDPERWLDQCVVDGTSKETCTSFQICGLFLGDQIMLGQLPYLISGKAIEKISKKLSKKTRDHMQDFVEGQFGMPPEFCSPESPVPFLL